MNAKRKMIISITALGVVLLAAIVAVVAVLAAQQVTIQSSITVSYEAGAHVYGTLDAKVKKPGETSFTNWQTITLNDGTAETGSLSNQSVTLTKTNKSVEFQFSLSKLSATADNFTAKLTYSSTKKSNVKIYVNNTETANTTLVNTVTIDSTTAEVYTIKIELIDAYTDATFEGAFSWVLNHVA